LRRIAIALAALAFSSPTLGQRVIEETLVINDPTVASPRNWIVGAAGEIWYVSGNQVQYDNNNNKTGEGNINFSQPGGSIWVGYGDFTVLLAARSGKGDQTLTYEPGVVSTQSITTTSEIRQKDTEIILRWLARPISARWVMPYVVVGYTQTKLDQDETRTDMPWPVINTRTRHFRYTYTGPLLGIGGIFPFNEMFGARGDLRVKFYNAEVTSEYGNKSGSGAGADIIVTGYMNFWRGFNLQAGIKASSLNGGDEVGSSLTRSGVFGMLGYTARF
jgi:hypothetical protein